MKFIREIPLSEVTQAVLNNLDQFGFTLVYTDSSIRVWGAL